MKEKDDGWAGFFKANPLFAPILFTLFILALATAPVHPEVCPNHEDYPCKDPIRYNFLFGLVAYLNTYSGAVIAIFTGTLWFSTRRQAILTRDIAQLSRDEFNFSIKRPWVFISGVHNLQIESARGDEDREPLATPRGRVFIEYAAANHGEAPAIVEEVFCEFMIVPEAFVPRVGQRDHQLMISPILGPSERVSIKEFLPQRMLRREGALLFNPQDGITTPLPEIPDEQELFFWIIVRYRGISSAGHETSALWRYEKDSSFTFMQTGGEERNYAN